MKLISITLNNFRQFYGKTPEIILAQGERNATIIHGNNGAGKTTLLNAFTWVLYEKFSAAFSAEDQLVNKRALAEIEVDQAVPCSVIIMFEHDNKRYQATRSCRAYRREKGVEYKTEQLRMLVGNEEGRWLPPIQYPEDIINRILPESLHQYFFFDGERIENFVRESKKAEIAAATKELLGVEVLDRAIRHLKEARKSLETDLRNIGDYETKKLLRDKQNNEKERDQLNSRQAEIEQELENQAEIKKTLSSRLLQLGGAKELQQLLQELENQRDAVKKQMKMATTANQSLISTKSYTTLLSDIVPDFRNFINQLREKGELPAGIKQQFVQELLQREQCICGAELKESTHAYHLVKAWMEKAGVADVEEIAIRLSTQIDEMDKQVPAFWQEVDQNQATINQSRTELSRIETQLDDTKKKLREFPDEDVSQLQKRLDSIDTKMSELNKEMGANQQQLESLKEEINKLGKQIDKHRMMEGQQLLVQRRISATGEAIDRLNQVKERLEQQFRYQLEQRVQEIFSSISFTAYLPKLNDQYELSLVEKTTGEENLVAASTGENQILSLSFIGGIIDRVREWSQKNTLMGPDSSTFPIVMDSPFGSLDEIGRRRVANSIPQLANQLVVLVTKTQWRGEVAEEMSEYAGREYVLSYHSPKPDCTEDFIERYGRDYPLVQPSLNEFEFTEIIEVMRE